MSVKSDNWIIHQCAVPTHRFHEYGSDKPRLIPPPYSEYQRQAIANWCPTARTERMMRKEYAVPLTVQEQASFKPMIEGAYDRPVRYVHRDTGLPYFPELGSEIPETVRKVISYGTSSYGYDVRLQADPTQIKVFTNVFVSEIDPKRMKEENFASPMIRLDDDGAKYVLIPAHSYIQAPTMEYFNIPRDILVIVLGKSTYARSALICNVTPIEPEFEGEVVIEVANVTNSPVRCYLEEGIAQFCFFQGDEPCLRSYKDKLGKYQGQRGLTFAKV